MDKKKLKQELAKALKSEMTGTGTGAFVTPGVGMGVATKYAFKKKVKEDAPQLAAGKVKDNYAVSHFGFKEAPSIANRKSDAIDYKKIFEGDPKPGVKYDYKGDSGFISTGGSSDPKNWKFLGDKGKYPYLSVKADLVPSEKQPGKYDGAFDYRTGGHLDESSNKIHIGTDTKTDSDVYFEPSTGTFSINVIDAAGNRTNKLNVNTIDDVLAKFPNWKWTREGELEFQPEEQGEDEDSYDWYTNTNLKEADTYDSLRSMLKQLGAEEDSIKVLVKAVEMGALKPSDTITITKKALGVKEGYGEFDMEDDEPDYNSISDLEDELRRLIRWSNQYGSKGADAKIDQLKKRIEDLKKQAINEGYARFRNETKMRSKPDQFHQAVKEIKKKMNEINRIFEYVDRLKKELSEGEELKYKKYTENAFQQIKESAKQLFFKSTKLK